MRMVFRFFKFLICFSTIIASLLSAIGTALSETAMILISNASALRETGWSIRVHLSLCPLATVARLKG